jgi:MFS family permease
MTPRQATFAAFLSFGVSIGLWSGSVPVVAAASGLDPALLGLAATGFIASAILGVAGAGLAARRIAIRRTLIAAVGLTALTCALALQANGVWTFLVLFLAFGFVSGLCDGTMNAEGTAVVRDLGRPVLAGFHAAASFASAISAGIGGAVSVTVGTAASGALALLFALAALAVILRACPARPVERPAPGAGPRPSSQLGVPILIMGLVAGISMAGEAAAIMFAASTIREQSPALAAYAGLGVTAFGLFQAAARSMIDRVRRHVPDTDIVLWSVALACFGFLIVATGSSAAQSAAGFAVIGIGTAAIVPCCFVIATRSSGLGAAQAIGLLSVVSAIPRVPQPLGFGEIADRWGFAAAFGLNAALMLIGLMLVLAVRRRTARRLA